MQLFNVADVIKVYISEFIKPELRRRSYILGIKVYAVLEIIHLINHRKRNLTFSGAMVGVLDIK